MTEPILAADRLTKKFALPAGPFQAPQTVTAVDRVCLELFPGETLGLAGESGCGKSTIAKALLGLIEPTDGDIRFHGAPLRKLDQTGWRQFRRSVQMVFQDPFASLNPRQRIGEIIAEPLVVHRLCRKAELRDRVIETMGLTGIRPDMYDRYPHEFSGGQRQRIGIARAIAMRPQAIVADEPLSALDISIQAQIINLLLDLKQSLGLSLVIISHDLAVIRHLTDRVAIMYLGRIVEQGVTAQVFRGPRHPYTMALLAAIPELGQVPGRQYPPISGDIPSPAAPPSGCHFHPRCPFARDLCRNTPPTLAEQQPGHLAACHFSSELTRTGFAVTPQECSLTN